MNFLKFYHKKYLLQEKDDPTLYVIENFKTLENDIIVLELRDSERNEYIVEGNRKELEKSLKFFENKKLIDMLVVEQAYIPKPKEYTKINRYYIEDKKSRDKFKIEKITKKEDVYIVEGFNQYNKRTELEITKTNISNFLFRENLKIVEPKKIYQQFLEDAGGGGMSTASANVGGTGDSAFSGDFYAPDDARNLYGAYPAKPMKRDLFKTYEVKKKKKKRKIKKKKKNGKKS